jgi:hypothetical protein
MNKIILKLLLRIENGVVDPDPHWFADPDPGGQK